LKYVGNLKAAVHVAVRPSADNEIVLLHTDTNAHLFCVYAIVKWDALACILYHEPQYRFKVGTKEVMGT